MSYKIPLSSICISDLERHYVIEALDNNMISSSGPHVKRFEELISSRTGNKYAVATSSGTSSLELLLRAMDIDYNISNQILVFQTLTPQSILVELVFAKSVYGLCLMM